jgi:arsenate reductase
MYDYNNVGQDNQQVTIIVLYIFKNNFCGATGFMKRILIISSQNSARSQMAEIFLKRITFNRVEVFSAGIKPGKIKKETVQVMAELGIEIAENRTKSVNEFYHDRFDFILTLSPEARESCPQFQGSHTKIHKAFDDPAAVKGSVEDKTGAYRSTRDSIKEWLTDFVERYQLNKV